MPIWTNKHFFGSEYLTAINIKQGGNKYGSIY